MQPPHWKQILDVLHKNGCEISCADVNQPWESSMLSDEADLSPSDLQTGFSQADIGSLIKVEKESKNSKYPPDAGKITLTQKGFDVWREEREFQYEVNMDKRKMKLEEILDTRQNHIEKEQHKINKNFKQSQQESQNRQSKLNRKLNILTAILAFSAVVQSIIDALQIWPPNKLFFSSGQKIYILLGILVIGFSLVYYASEK